MAADAAARSVATAGSSGSGMSALAVVTGTPAELNARRSASRWPVDLEITAMSLHGTGGASARPRCRRRRSSTIHAMRSPQLSCEITSTEPAASVSHSGER